MATPRIAVSTIAAIASIACASLPAAADQLQSWDRKIDNANARFVVLKDWGGEAVLDRETQLVWPRRPLPQLRTFSGAFNSCFAATVGGRRGWRVPAMEELTTLIDPTQAFPPLPAGHPFDVSGLSADVWSSTTVPGTNDAFTQDLRNDGFLGGFNKIAPLNVWCVRGQHGAEGQ